VEHQLESAYRKLRAFLDWPENFPINRTTLVSLLAAFIRGFPSWPMGERAKDREYRRLL